jgi:hypothetical protein
MDTTVNGIWSVVVAELRAAGYMESTIGQYEKTVKALAIFAGDSGSDYTASLGAAFAAMTVSPRTGRFSAQRRTDYGRMVTVFDRYVTTGRVDLAIRTRGGGGARPEGSEFIALAAAWEADMSERGLAPATREAYSRVARGYLVFLEARGIGVTVGQVGQVVVVLGGVELPPVLEVHRTHRSGRRGRAGQGQAFACDRADAVRPRSGACPAGVHVGGGQRPRRGDHAAGSDHRSTGVRHRQPAPG